MINKGELKIAEICVSKEKFRYQKMTGRGSTRYFCLTSHDDNKKARKEIEIFFKSMIGVKAKEIVKKFLYEFIRMSDNYSKGKTKCIFSQKATTYVEILPRFLPLSFCNEETRLSTSITLKRTKILFQIV